MKVLKTVILTLLVSFTFVLPSQAVVRIFDGFEDADLDNNGLIEAYDTDAGDSAFDAVDGLNTDLDYVPARLETGMETDPINTEVDTANDVNDVGIKWFQSRGFTGSNDGRAKPTARIVDDAQGAMLETAPLSTTGGLNNVAINSGYALSANSRGRGSSITGFFGESIALGPEEGDSVKVSFDFRIWRDAPALNTVLEPDDAELRFGLYQDTDNQLGMSNPVAGRAADTNNDGFLDPVSATWGEEEGQFEGIQFSGSTPGSEIGSPGDAGWFGAVILANPNAQFPPFVPNGGGWRIREETNIVGEGGERLLQGSDADTVAVPQESSPGANDFGLANLDTGKVWNLSLELVRATETTPGDTITAILTATDVTGGVEGDSFSLTGTEPLTRDDGFGGTEDDGISSDSWDYFAIRNTGFDDFDYILDNFMLETFSANSGADVDGDGDVDGADFLQIQRDDPSLIAQWQAEYAGAGSSAAAAVPEPTTSLLALVSICTLGMVRRK